MTTIDSTRTQNLLSNGGFLADPFLEASNPLTSTPLIKSTKCVSDGTLAGAIIGTLILSAFAAFLSWLIYLRPKFQELYERQAYDKFHEKFSFPSREHPKQRLQKKTYDNHGSDLPLDAVDYKFGTFPFRQSQIPQTNHNHGQDWLNRISASFRSMNLNQNVDMLDIELLDPTFGGLNFNITGSMKAGIFVKDIIDYDENKPDNQLKTGDRIMALTICFKSIVYEDALTILSYASPYPVVLRIQRFIDSPCVKTVHETRPSGTGNSTSKVKWREEFEHYDNDSRSKYSFIHSVVPDQTDLSPSLPIRNKPNITIATSSTLQPRSSTKRASSRMNTEPRMNTKTSTTEFVNRNSKTKTTSNSVLATSGAAATRQNSDRKKNISKPKGNYSNGMSLDRRSTQKTIMTSIATTTTIHERERQEKGDIDHPYPSEDRLSPHYDSPYDCFDDQLNTQYQYLHQSHLNRNNNNSLSMESLTMVTPCLSRSIHSLSVIRPFDRRASSPAVLLSSISSQPTSKDWNDISLNHTDTFV